MESTALSLNKLLPTGVSAPLQRQRVVESNVCHESKPRFVPRFGHRRGCWQAIDDQRGSIQRWRSWQTGFFLNEQSKLKHCNRLKSTPKDLGQLADCPKPPNSSQSFGALLGPWESLKWRLVALWGSGAILGPLLDGRHSTHNVLHYEEPTVSLQGVTNISTPCKRILPRCLEGSA